MCVAFPVMPSSDSHGRAQPNSTDMLLLSMCDCPTQDAERQSYCLVHSIPWFLEQLGRAAGDDDPGVSLSPCRAPHFGGGMVTAIRCPSSRLLASLSPCPLGEHRRIQALQVEHPGCSICFFRLLITSPLLRFKSFFPAVIQGQLVGQGKIKSKKGVNKISSVCSLRSAPLPSADSSYLLSSAKSSFASYMRNCCYYAEHEDGPRNWPLLSEPWNCPVGQNTLGGG